MKQLLQRLANGRPCVLDVPAPILEPGFVLVRNHYSVVSSGTEGATVRSARKNLVGKALERPKEVKAVLELLKRQGLTQTYRTVTKKLDAYSPMGYSSAGEVVEVGEGVSEFRVGDLVACAGVGYANHAELASVPENLCVKLSADADLKAAAYNTIGAIAMQGVRQADLRLGETCVVIGLGLVGLTTCLILKASGVEVYGVDVDPYAIEKARAAGVDARLRSDATLEASLLSQTHGIGADAVVIAAGSSSLDPINFAGKLARRKGRVVVLGAVPTGFDRNPDYYPKELELRMSCSYGPGRYDMNYEEKGFDYPASYVRWTEKRNMQAFQRLLETRRLDAAALTTHEYALDDAPQAYDMILSGEEKHLGVVLRYAATESRAASRPTLPLASAPAREEVRQGSALGYAFIGAGSYAQGLLLPNIPKDANLRPVGVVSRSGATAKRVAERFGFAYASSDPAFIYEDDAIDAVFIATRHDSHAQYALEALKARKNVFLEKPLCITLDEYAELRGAYEVLANAGTAPRLTLGFNRRFAPLALELKDRLGDARSSIVYRVNAGMIPGNTWIQDKTFGGGRILGEVCHFIDFVSWLANSAPISVYAASLQDGTGFDDVVSISLKLENGSIASVHYFSNGSKSVPKERVEVYQAGATGVLDDFRSLQVFGPSERFKKKSIQDKGQKNLLRAFFEAIKTGAPSPVPENEAFHNTLATFAVLESLTSGREIALR